MDTKITGITAVFAIFLATSTLAFDAEPNQHEAGLEAHLPVRCQV